MTGRLFKQDGCVHIVSCDLQVQVEICLTLEVLLDPLVLRLSPLLEFLLKINQELRGDTLDRSEDSGSWGTQTTTQKVHMFHSDSSGSVTTTLDSSRRVE